MENKILSITEKFPKPTTLPDGSYLGIWGGSNIDVEYKGKTYNLKTEEGVRGFGIKVIVTIKDGVGTFGEWLKN